MKIKLMFCAAWLITGVTSFAVFPEGSVENKKSLKRRVSPIESWELSSDQQAKLQGLMKKTASLTQIDKSNDNES